jgi:hypothetical protein
VPWPRRDDFHECLLDHEYIPWHEHLEWHENEHEQYFVNRDVNEAEREWESYNDEAEPEWE